MRSRRYNFVLALYSGSILCCLEKGAGSHRYNQDDW